MFNLGDWTLDKLISGVKRGDFSSDYAAVKVADYIIKNVMTEAHALKFDAEIAANTTYEPATEPTAEQVAEQETSIAT